MNTQDGALGKRPRPKGFLLCGGPRCRRFTLAHPLLRKDGVFLGGDWLCSGDCLQAATAAALRAKAPCEQLSMPRLPRMPFRLHLLQRGVITEGELGDAQRYAKERSASLSEALLELGCVREEQLAAAHAAENGCAFFALPPVAIPRCLQLPCELTRRSGAAATVHATHDRILIGFVHRLDRMLLKAVEQVFGRRAEGCFVAASRYQAQLAADRAPASSAARHLPASTRIARPEAGRLLRELALREGAEWIRAGYPRDAVWFRWWRSEERYGDLVLELASDLDGKRSVIPDADRPLSRPARIRSPKWEEKKLRVL